MSENDTKEEMWEFFIDYAYFGTWCVRKKTDKKLGKGFHVNDGIEAESLCRILNEYNVE